MRNVTSLKPKQNKDIFKRIPKFSEVFVPFEVAVDYLHDLYAGVDLPATLTKTVAQQKLDKAYSMGDTPWRVVIG